MPERSLERCRILVVEDEYMLAQELAGELADVGATVIGPVGNLADAITSIEREGHIDGAVLDINLGGDPVFPAADMLVRRGVPIVLTTGYDESMIPARFAEYPRCEKPIDMRKVTAAIGRVLHA